eukprot:s699_g41.t4
MTEGQQTVSLNWLAGSSSSAEDDEDELCCRICRQGEEAGKLYCPCRCAGSIKWIHGACLQAWLKSYERKPACELCGYPFDFIPVYSKNAPHQLTLADWVGAFCSSSWRVSHRVLRILYAIGLWGIVLPILTIMATRSIFGRRARPELTSAWHVLPLTLDIFIGECLSLAGIAFIYFLSFLTAVRTTVSTDGRSSEGSSQAADGEASSAEPSSSIGSQAEPRQRLNEHDPEEDLMVIMGLSGNPVRSFLSMLIFLSANVAGVYLFLGIPSFLGRWTLRSVLPWIQAISPDVVAVLLWSSSETELSRSSRPAEDRQFVSGRPVMLPSAGANVLLDMLGVAMGYFVVACCAISFVLVMLLLGAAAGYNSRSWQALRTLVNIAENQLCNFASEGWWRFQRLTVAILQWVVFPAYVGHLVLCFLCGPVLHLSQQSRASIMNSNPLISFVMQLFIGYVHLWGFAFMEGCIASVLVPEAIQRASVNFFVGAINCHRRLFGTMSEDVGTGTADSLPMPPHWATLKLALVHVAVHTPLVFTVWYLPAYLLDRLLGEALFPMLLVDHSGEVLEGLHRRDPLFLSSSMASVRSNSKAAVGEGQSLFVLELLQLYVLVLQCIRILETSPVMTKLISALLRCGLRFVGLGHLLVGESESSESTEEIAATRCTGKAILKNSWIHWATKRGKILGVTSMLILCCWSVMALVMALPLALGRLIVRCILSSQAKQISDFLPLSMGVVVASAWILVMVKLGEALPRILEQASALRRRRCLHIITCGFSAFGMAVAVINFIKFHALRAPETSSTEKIVPYRCNGSMRGAMLGSSPLRTGICGSTGPLKHVSASQHLIQRKARSGGCGSSRSFFFQRSQGALLGIKGLERAENFPTLAREAVQESRQRLTNLEGRSPGELVSLVDGVSNSLCQIADAAELVRNVHPQEAYVSNASSAVQEVAGFMSEVNLDIGVYEPMKKAEESREFEEMSLEARTVLHHMRVSMEHEGIHLPAAEKTECMELLDSEQQLSFEILNRQEQLRHQASEEGAWVPLDSLDGFGDLRGHIGSLPRRKASQEEVLIPRDSMLADQILKTAPSPEARQRIHEAQQKRDAVGEEHMVSLLAVRQRLAKLRGYESWAHWAQRDALFTSPQNVQSFLDSAWQRLRPGLEAELRLLSEEKQSLGQEKVLHAWDVPYFLQRCRQKHTEADEISEFLTYPTLMKGVELILSRLLGLSFTQEEPEAGELWHPSVQKYAIRDEKQILGILYLDPFQRPGKRIQSAQFTLQGSKLLDDGRQTPKTCLVYALPPTVREALPLRLRQAHRQHPFSHFEAVQQLMYAAADQAFFDFHPSASAEAQVPLVHQHLQDSFSKYELDLDGPYKGSLMEMLGLSTPSRFDHLVHYGGSYYCYLFNRALAAHVWRQSFEADPFNPEVGVRLRGLVLFQISNDSTYSVTYRILQDLIGSVVQTLDVIRELHGDAFAAHEAACAAFRIWDSFAQAASSFEGAVRPPGVCASIVQQAGVWMIYWVAVAAAVAALAVASCGPSSCMWLSILLAGAVLALVYRIYRHKEWGFLEAFRHGVSKLARSHCSRYLPRGMLLGCQKRDRINSSPFSWVAFASLVLLTTLEVSVLAPCAKVSFEPLALKISGNSKMLQKDCAEPDDNLLNLDGIVPIVFLVTDCWSVGLILTKVLWRLVQSDMIMHSLHQEIMAVWNEAQGSLTYIFFNLRSHWRIWRTSVLPMLEVIVFHLVFPLTAALTLLQFVGAGHEYLKAALLMYCYHIVLILRITLSALPRGRTWLREVRQQIFDSKYLISTELQNYHQAADSPEVKEDSQAEPPARVLQEST